MKNLILMAVLFSIVSLVVMADEIPLSSHSEDSSFKLVKEDLRKFPTAILDTQCHLKSVITETVETVQGPFSKVTIPGFALTQALGKPQLPVLTRSLELPMEMEVSAEVLSKTATEFSLASLQLFHPIYPSQSENPENTDFAYDIATYQKGYSQKALVSVKAIGIIPGARVWNIQVVLADYDPLQSKIKFYNDIVIRLHFNNMNLGTLKSVHQALFTPIIEPLVGTAQRGSPVVQLSTDKYCHFAQNDGQYTISTSEASFKLFGNTYSYDYSEDQGMPSRVMVSLAPYSAVEITPAGTRLQDGSVWTLVPEFSMAWIVKASKCAYSATYKVQATGRLLSAYKKVQINYAGGTVNMVGLDHANSDPSQLGLQGGDIPTTWTYHLEIYVLDFDLYKDVHFNDGMVEWRDTFNMSKVICRQPLSLCSKSIIIGIVKDDPLLWASPIYTINLKKGR